MRNRNDNHGNGVNMRDVCQTQNTNIAKLSKLSHNAEPSSKKTISAKLSERESVSSLSLLWKNLNGALEGRAQLHEWRKNNTEYR